MQLLKNFRFLEYIYDEFLTLKLCLFHPDTKLKIKISKKGDINGSR